MRWVDPAMEIGAHTHDLHPGIQARLTEWLATLAPPTDEELVAHRWAGTMAWTRDRLPLVGRVPGRDRVWAALGYSGHGLPAAPLAAAILTARLNGEEPPGLADFLDPASRLDGRDDPGLY
jgi:glycine/D-amino acid oxidase-like deaminating enzyme